MMMAMQMAICSDCANCSTARCRWVASNGTEEQPGMIIDWQENSWKGSKVPRLGKVIDCDRYQKESPHRRSRLTSTGAASLLEAVAKRWQEDYIDALRYEAKAFRRMEESVVQLRPVPDDLIFALKMVQTARAQINGCEVDLRKGLLADFISDPAAVIQAVRAKA